MAEQTGSKVENKELDIEAILKKQKEEFQAEQKALREEMQNKIDTMADENKKLTEELSNLKTNTAEENALLGEQIAKISNVETKPSYNPFAEGIMYDVYNEKAGIHTKMTGDEVKGIIGSIDKHLKLKLISGAKSIEKYPYKITLIEQKNKG